ncbi:hypothetical protein A374_05906 [Fictibacillus macauensis ZFHKF-1]|uniref:Spore coat protein n=1 Tax=Fictibacillus macauensis ZFHKF-1 TaxID=1196324 RepID=I8UI35_9BACL|nr:hypothetical protein [Fictibacillus macauensis]EIT86473.1 hypothetical protein A374_05906 [Fictibacillus macauensis ZFHKF-1]
MSVQCCSCGSCLCDWFQTTQAGTNFLLIPKAQSNPYPILFTFVSYCVDSCCVTLEFPGPGRPAIFIVDCSKLAGVIPLATPADLA